MDLIKKGFYQSHEDNVICRFRYEDVKVDVMATRAVGWAPANPWFAPGYESHVTFDIANLTIKCLSLPYFLATKFTAFYDRGSKDPRTSHDFEDIVYLLNHTSSIKEQVLSADEKVKIYLIKCFEDILEDKVQQEAIRGNLYYEEQEFRYNKIVTLLKQICNNL